jgi:methyl-accepting chemotaxis protein
MDQVTQQNAALVEEAAAAAEAMQDQASKLTQTISVFKIDTVPTRNVASTLRSVPGLKAAIATRAVAQVKKAAPKVQNAIAASGSALTSSQPKRLA